MPWAGGVYTRGYPSWSNDAANNLPISSSKFDLEDNDFATGLNNCLTKDGLNIPTATLNWSQTAAVVMNLSRGSDGTIATFSRTGGSNNPQLQVVNADATGMSLNLSTNQQLSLAIAGTAVLALSAATATLNPTTSGSLGLAAVPVIAWSAGQITCFNSAVTGGATATFQNTSAVAGDTVRVKLVANATDFTIFAANAATAGALITNGPTGAQTVIRNLGAYPILFGVNNTLTCSINPNGNWVWAAPTATGSSAFTFNGIAGNNVMLIQAGATSGTAFGLVIQAGTTTADYALNVKDQTNTNTYFQVQGDGQIFMRPPTAASISGTVFQVGYLDLPQNLQNAAYGLILTDRGKSIYHTSGSAHTYTIPANASIAFPVGTAITIINEIGAGVVTLAITTDTLEWFPAGTTGSRSLAAGTCATILKVTTTKWVLTGVGIS